jgi:hypothetical protein
MLGELAGIKGLRPRLHWRTSTGRAFPGPCGGKRSFRELYDHHRRIRYFLLDATLSATSNSENSPWKTTLRDSGGLPQIYQGSVQKAVQISVGHPNRHELTFHKALAILTCHIFGFCEVHVERPGRTKAIDL